MGYITLTREADPSCTPIHVARGPKVKRGLIRGLLAFIAIAEDHQVIVFNGGSGWIRTSDQGIMSPLL